MSAQGCVCGSARGDDNRCPVHGPERLRIALTAANVRLAAVTRERDLARKALADLLAERRGLEVTEFDDEETAMERIAKTIVDDSYDANLPDCKDGVHVGTCRHAPGRRKGK